MAKPYYGDGFTDRYSMPVNKIQRGEDADKYIITAADNPKCGDDVLLYLQIVDDRIVDGRFGGDSCAICTVSADTLVDSVRGKTLEEAKKLADIFGRMCKNQALDPEMEVLGAAALLRDVAPKRRECAVLPWKALKRAISDAEKRITK